MLLWKICSCLQCASRFGGIQVLKALLSQLKWIGCLWLAGASAFVLVGIMDLWMKKGWPAVQTFLSPYNFFNWIVIAMTLAPGLIPLVVLGLPVRGGSSACQDRAAERLRS